MQNGRLSAGVHDRDMHFCGFGAAPYDLPGVRPCRAFGVIAALAIAIDFGAVASIGFPAFALPPSDLGGIGVLCRHPGPGVNLARGEDARAEPS